MNLNSVVSFQVHAYIIGSLKKEMPSMFGKDTRKKELIQNLGETFAQIQREHQISPGDFPDLSRMKQMLQDQVTYSQCYVLCVFL